MPPKRPARSSASKAAPKEPPAAPPPKRRATRTKVKQEEVDEEVQVTQALIADDDEEEEDIVAPPPKRAKRTTASRRVQSTGGDSGSAKPESRRKAVAPIQEEEASEKEKDEDDFKGEPADEDDEEEDYKPSAPKPRAKPASSKKAPPKSNSRKRMVQSESEPEEKSVEQEDPADRSKSERADEDDEDEDDAFLRKAKERARSKPPSSRAPPKSKGKASSRPSIESAATADSDADLRSVKSKSQSVAPTVKAQEPSDEESEADDLMATIRNVPPTPAAGRRGLTVPPTVRRPGLGLGLAPGSPTMSEINLSVEPELPSLPKSRLVIHKMALVNFKSYAGRQEIGPFHKSFSAIVGPNGSGKSNTIDALLFVFGYRASKMRQGKLSELIHHSADYPDLDHCSVEVHFREIEDLPGQDAYKVVPKSNLVVTRTAFKNNTSKYTINDGTSSFTEVTTLLKERGIDLDHKRFLILQGEVESIALMKPKAPNEHEDGLLEYLEDIIGTSKYKEDIEKSLIDVDRLNEERSERLNRLRLVEKDKASLEERKKEAEDWLRNKNGLVRAQNALWQFWTWRHEQTIQELETANETLAGQLKAERDKNADTIAQNEELQNVYDERVKAVEVIKKETQPLIKQLSSLEKQEVQLGEKKKHVITKGKKLKKSLNEDRHTKNAADQAIENNTEAIEKGRGELEKLELSLEKEESELEKIRESLKDKTEVFHAQIESKQKELDPWTNKVNKKQAEIDLATNERDMLKEKAAALTTSVDEAAQVMERLSGEREAKLAELEDLKQEKSNVAKELVTGEKKLQAMATEGDRLKTKASASRQKADEAKASQAASTSQNAVLDNLQRLKAAGRITGFHGRLGDLGTIPDKYDIAVSTACTSLNFLVVDQVKEGEACLNYLKKQNVGRANIYVLEKLPSNIPQVNTPENVPRLYDLVTPKDPRFAPAFYKGLRDTLVADTMEQANRIAFGGQKRWRVVTLAGQLIESSGAMSGGGSRVSKGLMSSKFAASETVRPEVLRQYEQEMEAADNELQNFAEQRREFEVQLDNLRRRGPQIDMSISKVELDIKTGEKRIADAQKRLKALQSQNKPDAGEVKRIATLETQIASGSKELETLREKTNAIESSIRDLQNKILEIGGVRLRSQKAKVDGIKEMIDLANEQITKAEVGMAKSQKDSERLEQTISTGQNTLEELAGELEELEGTLATCVQDIGQLRQQVEMVREVAEKHQEELEEMKAELDQKMELINEFRSKELAIKQKINRNTQVLSEEAKTVKALRANLRKLDLADVDDEDEEEEKPQVQNAPTTEGEEEPKTQEAERPASVEADAPAPLELQEYNEQELEGMDENLLKGEVAKLEGLMKEGQPNMKALEEYRKREAEFLRRAKDLEAITEARDAEKKRYDELRKTRLEEFMSGFNTISSKLKEMYQMITLGGNAELELVDSMDPFSEGIIFSVMPPKKSWKNISNLSGGEKTLSSLALVFALHVFKPTPLYFMDEIDAALDFRNVSIVANYIKDRTKNAQFIIISLRNDMFELSHRLIGIYKTSNATRSIAIDNKALNTPRPAPAVA